MKDSPSLCKNTQALRARESSLKSLVSLIMKTRLCKMKKKKARSTLKKSRKIKPILVNLREIKNHHLRLWKKIPN